jgi:hypothetical protein
MSANELAVRTRFWINWWRIDSTSGHGSLLSPTANATAERLWNQTNPQTGEGLSPQTIAYP